MPPAIKRTKPSLLEAGLPCASLSAESQRDNNARQRPPQNRLHIWWARRAPTVCRSGLLSALLPHDMALSESALPKLVQEPTAADLQNLPRKQEPNRTFYETILSRVGPTALTVTHSQFVRAMGIAGDAAAAYDRLALRDELCEGRSRITLPDSLVYRHPPALTVPPSRELLSEIRSQARRLFGETVSAIDTPMTVVDSMAGGGSIPLEAVRYGFQAYANDLNPVACLVLKATVEYPAKFSSSLAGVLERSLIDLSSEVSRRLMAFFPVQAPSVWWPELDPRSLVRLRSGNVILLAPNGEESVGDYLWIRQVPCPNCGLLIPISTNFSLVTKKGKPEATIAAFPVVPALHEGNVCTFRIVRYDEWSKCVWPRPGFQHWHPRETPTFKDGAAICPRCPYIVDKGRVKEIAKSRPGGLKSQLYTVCAQVPVKLTYRNGEEKVRYLWRFRTPAEADLDAVLAGEDELNRLLPRWEAQDLVPNEDIPLGDKTREPRNVGILRWRDLFLPRQLLTNMVILEEIRHVQEKVREEHSADQAEAIGVYLAFVLDKVINYNSVNTFWHYGRKTVAQTFSRHDFAFRPAFCEFEGARETVMWAGKQVLDAYKALARLIHGETVALTADTADDEEIGDLDESTISGADGDDEDDTLDDDDALIAQGRQDAIVEADEPPLRSSEEAHLRAEVVPPIITCQDAAALDTPAPGTVHLICVDPPYYNNVQYSELSNFFYVWLRRSLRDFPDLAPLLQEPLAESNTEAVANAARWEREAAADLAKWKARYEQSFAELRAERVKVAAAKARAREAAGLEPATAQKRADRFYEDKMASVFRRARALLHPAGRMVVMFNHRETWAWRSLGMALIRAGFEIRSSAPIHTEAESSLNIRGLDAARSTVLLLCMPREEIDQPVGNWGTVQNRVASRARAAAELFQDQGLSGTDLYLSALGPALGQVASNWPVTDFSGRAVDLEIALEEAYRAVGEWRLDQVLAGLTASPDFAESLRDFSAQTVDKDTRTLWLWLDTFEGELASSDDVRKLAKSLNVDPNDFKRMGLLSRQKDVFSLRAPLETDLRLLARKLGGEIIATGRSAREADVWEQRTFPTFVGGAVWNAIVLMSGDGGSAGVGSLRQWLHASGYATQREFAGAFAVTLHLLERVFGKRPHGSPWHEAARQARRAWDLAIRSLPQ
jgi:putative DNA methylase